MMGPFWGGCGPRLGSAPMHPGAPPGTQAPPQARGRLGWVGKGSGEGGSASPISQAGREPAASN